MKVRYDPTADALSVDFAPGPSVETEELDPGRYLAYAEDGHVISVEFLGVSRGMDLTGIPRAEEIATELRRLHIPIKATATTDR